MFTFKAEKNKNPLFYIDGKPVYTTFNKNDADRIPPYRDSSKYLNSDEFRERYTLSKREQNELVKALRSNIVPDNNLKGKFFHIRRDLNQRLFTEIDLRGTDHKIDWRFPMNPKEWPETQIIIGSSGVGKTHKIVSEITEALKRSKKRKFIYVSPELQVDSTLKKLINTKRWSNFFEGIDVSDEAYQEWKTENGGGDPDGWWTDVIFPVLDNLEKGVFVVLDDAPDSVVHRHLQKWLIKYLRTGRHKQVGVGSLQHLVRGRKWTSQSFSSVKWVVLFPRGGGKGKQVEWLYENLGVGRKRARALVDIFGSGGRWMMIHQWSPSVIFGPTYAVWV
jgi:hypothetical protein